MQTKRTGCSEVNWLFNVTINDISVIYVTAHRCAGGLKKLDLRSGWSNAIDISKGSLKLTCHHINRRHFCFNIKSISVHPLLWMNVMLDFICMVFAGM